MHPIVFEFKSLRLTWYGVLVVLGFVAGLWTAGRRGQREGVEADRIYDLGPWLILGAILGSRTLHVISYWKEEFASESILEVFKVWHGGLVFYGGLIGASLACVLYARVKRIPLWQLADITAPSIALGHVFGRLGCLLNGCCYGVPCAQPWAVTFPADSKTAPPGIPLHPTQIYEALLNLALYGALAWLYRHRQFRGQVFAAYLLGYALLRSVVELFRGDYDQHYLGGWATPAHLVSLAGLGVGAALFLILRRFKSPADSRG